MEKMIIALLRMEMGIVIMLVVPTQDVMNIQMVIFVIMGHGSVMVLVEEREKDTLAKIVNADHQDRMNMKMPQQVNTVLGDLSLVQVIVDRVVIIVIRIGTKK
mgnify:CR=1 FL=1